MPCKFPRPFKPRLHYVMYLSLIYNIYAEHRQKVITFPIRKMWPLGDPEEIKQFKKDFVNLKRSNHDDT